MSLSNRSLLSKSSTFCSVFWESVGSIRCHSWSRTPPSTEVSLPVSQSTLSVSSLRHSSIRAQTRRFTTSLDLAFISGRTARERFVQYRFAPHSKNLVLTFVIIDCLHAMETSRTPERHWRWQSISNVRDNRELYFLLPFSTPRADERTL